MSYQVLARKWRPRRFGELAGQEHVVRALVNALDSGRVHHAFLFTGTRGVGKTTIARIFAKSLNCEKGVTSDPCGGCGACTEVDGGRFVDLIEVDAASRTKVDDTRELLENVQYTPTRGRYKVYLIDEVHMFSTSSFNALLKTLEEPPPHVKFLLATTDPQRLPATILSRCLQFNLKRLPLETIRDRLAAILDAEQLAYEPPALLRLARAADGSMRDGLSLLDQAIAHGGGRVTDTDVRAMLGAIEGDAVYDLIDAAAAGDAAAALAAVQAFSERGSDYGAFVEELLTVLHRIALAQALPDTLDEALEGAARVRALVGSAAPEDIQLFYQMALHARRDLWLAPDPRLGCEMLALRLASFALADEAAAGGATPRPAPRTASAPVRAAPAPRPEPKPAPAAAPQATARPAAPLVWEDAVEGLGASGMVREFARQCALLGRDGDTLRLALDPEHAGLRTKSAEEKLLRALQERWPDLRRLDIQVAGAAQETPAQARARAADERQQKAEETIRNDPLVQALERGFDAKVRPGTVKPV